MKRGKPLKRNKALRGGKPLKRTPLKSGTKPPKPRKPLAQGKPLPGRNAKRQAAARERDFGKWRDKVVRMPCWWCGATPRHGCAPAHAKTRATGHDRRALLPMCPTLPGRTGCHDLYDTYNLPAERQVEHTYTSHDDALAAAHQLYDAHHPEPQVP